MEMKQIAVLGLSRFGASVARSLAHVGVEVMGVDVDAEKVEELAREITHVVQANILDADALQSLGLRNFDVVVLSVKDIETSCLAIMKLRDCGAGYIVAQAGGEAHAKILERIGADKVIMPERDMGERLARSLAGDNIIDYMELSASHSLMEFGALEEWVDLPLKESNIRQRHNVSVVAIRSGKQILVAPDGNAVVRAGDILVVIGENEDLERLNKYSLRKR